MMDEGSTDSRQIKSEGDTPRFLADVKQSKVIWLYVNGDEYFSGKRICLKDRNLDGFLKSCTESLHPKFGYIRHVTTPQHGHRISDLSQIQDRGKYVACGTGSYGRFKKINYEDIEPITNKSPRRPNNQGFDTFSLPKAPPVGSHNRQYQNVESRVNKKRVIGRNIIVCENGQSYKRSHNCLLRPALLDDSNIDRVLSELAENLIPYYIRVHKLYTAQGEEVVHPSQLEHNQVYVAAGDRFRPGDYGITTEPKNFITTRGQGYPIPYYLSDKFRWDPFAHLKHKFDPQKRRPKTWTSRMQLAPIKHSPNQSVNSNPEYGSRKHLAKRKQPNGAPYSSPQKHTVRNNGRGQGPKQGPAPTKQNNNILTNGNDQSPFKASKTSEATKGAKPVNDSQHTRTEVPIDQRPAETVKEDILDDLEDEETMSMGSTAIELNRRPSDESDRFQEEKIKGSNSKRSDSIHDEKIKGSNSKRSDSLIHHDKDLNPHKPLPAINKKSDARDNETPSPQAKNKDMSEEDAAVTIQAAFRGHQDRKMIEEKKKEVAETKKADPPKADSPKVKDTKDDKDNDSQQGMSEEEAATKIQASIRGHQARKEIEQMKEQKEKVNNDSDNSGKSDREKEEEAAIVIQASVRGHLARQEIEEKKREEAAAIAIQSNVRGHIARKEIEQKKEEKAATTIQASIRGHMARREIEEKKKEKAAQEENGPSEKTNKVENENAGQSEELSKEQAAITIQSALRGFEARKEVERKRMENAAVTIQAGIRGYDARKQVAAKREEMQKEKAATTIQSAFRGHQGRKEFEEMKKDHQSNPKTSTPLSANFEEDDNLVTRTQRA